MGCGSLTRNKSENSLSTLSTQVDDLIRYPVEILHKPRRFIRYSCRITQESLQMPIAHCRLDTVREVNSCLEESSLVLQQFQSISGMKRRSAARRLS